MLHAPHRRGSLGSAAARPTTRGCPLPDETTRAELARLRTDLAVLRREVHRRQRIGRLLPWAAVVLLLALLPLALGAATPFNDLNPGSVHNANIDAIYN